MTNYGWICPRCQKVHAPAAQTCACAPSTLGAPLPNTIPHTSTLPFIQPTPNGWPLPLPSTCRMAPITTLNDFVCGSTE